MTVDLSALFQGLIGAAILGFGVDHFRLRSEVSAFKVHVAENLASKNDVKDLKSAVEKVDSRVESMIELLYAIKGQVGAQGHDGSR